MEGAGWIRVDASSPRLSGLWAIGNRNMSSLDGAGFDPLGTNEFIFPELTTDGSTLLQIVNPNMQTVRGGLSLRTPGRMSPLSATGDSSTGNAERQPCRPLWRHYRGGFSVCLGCHQQPRPSSSGDSAGGRRCCAGAPSASKRRPENTLRSPVCRRARNHDRDLPGQSRSRLQYGSDSGEALREQRDPNRPTPRTFHPLRGGSFA